jgi:hypothetical protein
MLMRVSILVDTLADLLIGLPVTVGCLWNCGMFSIGAGSDHLRVVFCKQMGLSDKDIVALSGAHTLVSMFP